MSNYQTLHKIAVYGSLRRGEGNHGHFLKDSPFVEEKVLKGFDLIDLGSFPGMVRGSGEVVVEVYKVTSAQLRRLDLLEGHPSFYHREEVEPGLEAYVFQGRRGLHVPGGDWVAYRKERDRRSQR